MWCNSGARRGLLRPAMLILVAVALVGGCAFPQPRSVEYGRRVPGADVPPPQRVSRPVTDLAIYPERGQRADQLRRDRFECHEWAVRQSGFDPATMSRPTPTPVPRVETSPPAGSGLVQGTLAGAAVGAAVANPHHAGDGALVGAVIGAVAGASSDAARQARAERIEDAYAQHAAARDHAYAETEDRYRRAIEACLDGRGYRVQSFSQ